MKKLFSFIMVALMSIMTLNAETTRIYCKMAQNWWKVDNAAVGCHSWGTPGPGTTWPGVRMTPVENETDMWYIDLDVTKVQNVIFTRVNASGAIADWGAKTKNLTIPTNGDNLFTITTSSESWGDPGCDGDWSKYGKEPEPVCQDGPYGLIVNNKDTVHAVAIEDADPLGRKQYRMDSVLVALNDSFVVANLSCTAKWVMEIEKAGAYENFAANANNVKVLKAGYYNMYIKLSSEQGDLMYIEECKEPEPGKYYAKNNWDKAAEWSWLEMSATNVENVYMLDSVVFGGTGVNINTKADDADALYFAVDKISVLNGLDGLPFPYIPEPRKHDTVLYAPARLSAVLGAPTLQAGDTIKLFFNASDSKLSALIIGSPEPVEEGFGIIVNGTEKIKGQKNEAQTEFLEYMIEANLTAGATFQLYDFANDAAWTEANIDEASTPNVTINNDVYVASATGKYTIYLKMYGIGNNQVYFAFDGEEPVGDKYYVTGNAALVGEEKAWAADAIEMVDNTYTFPMLAAGEYQLKVTDGTWEHAWGYDNLSPTVAVEGLYTDVDGNICFTVYTPNDVTVTFAQGYVVVTGDFKNPQPAEEGFGIIVNGTEKIKGQKNEEQTEWLEYMIEANLTAGATFQLYDFANDAAWTESNIDEASTPNVTINNDVYVASATGKYTIYLKMYGIGNNQVYFAYEGEEPPAEEGFGIILGDGTTIKGTKNEGQVEFLEYMIEANLTAGATFQLYDFANDAAWTEANIDEASTPNVTINNDVYVASATGKYTIYLKMYGIGNNQVYIAFDGQEPSGLNEIMRNAKDGKFIINGNMIIRRNGALYTIQGARL